MTMWVHYLLSDGSIIGWENSPEHCVEMAGVGSVSIPGLTSPDYKTQKIDLASLDVIGMTSQEIAIANSPRLEEVRGLVAVELSESDIFFSVPDFPMSETTKAAWLVYRQQLRDISKNDMTPSEMILRWPDRPDGLDVSLPLRKRIIPA